MPALPSKAQSACLAATVVAVSDTVTASAVPAVWPLQPPGEPESEALRGGCSKSRSRPRMTSGRGQVGKTVDSQAGHIVAARAGTQLAGLGLRLRRS